MEIRDYSDKAEISTNHFFPKVEILMNHLPDQIELLNSVELIIIKKLIDEENI